MGLTPWLLTWKSSWCSQFHDGGLAHKKVLSCYRADSLYEINSRACALGCSKSKVALVQNMLLSLWLLICDKFVAMVSKQVHQPGNVIALFLTSCSYRALCLCKRCLFLRPTFIVLLLCTSLWWESPVSCRKVCLLCQVLGGQRTGIHSLEDAITFFFKHFLCYMFLEKSLTLT